MSGTRTWNPGDPCPGCGGELRQMRKPTDAERRHAADRDNPLPLPRDCDTAPQEVVDDHGDLFQCATCGPQIRYKAPADANAGGDVARAPRPR
jgi:hypothetical protein